MTHVDLRRECPPLRTLVEWFEGTLDEPAAERTERHLDHCGHCRQSLLDWSERAGSAETALAGCPDEETLLAYCVTPMGLEPAPAAGVEEHLRQCARCVRALQHVMQLHRQMECDEPPVASMVHDAAPELVDAPRPATRVAGVAEQLWQRLRGLFTPTLWPGAALATAVAVVVAIGIAQFVGPSAELRQMRVRSGELTATVEVTMDTPGHVRPDVDEPVVVHLNRGTRVRRLEVSGEWMRIEHTDGRRVWIQSRAVAEVRAE